MPPVYSIVAPAATLSNAGHLVHQGRITGGGVLHNLSTGVISGNGVIETTLINDGQIQPGNSPGALTAAAGWQQTATGTYVVEIAGMAPVSEFDMVLAGGPVMLGGTLEVRWLDGYQPLAGQSFTILQLAEGSLSGAFDTIVIEGAGPEVQFQVEYADDAVRLNAQQPFVVELEGPTTVVRSQPVSLRLVVDGAPQDETFTFAIDWDGDGQSDQVVVGPSGTEVTGRFDLAGRFDVTVEAVGTQIVGSMTGSRRVDVVPFALVPREGDAGVTDLVWGGTPGIDAVFFLPHSSGNVSIVAPLVDSTFVAQIDMVSGVNGRVIAYGNSGNDIMVAEFIGLPVVFDGGADADLLMGGRAADTLLGGDGDDLLTGGTRQDDLGDALLGGAGNDVLYGHLGNDILRGEAGDDLLIAGRLDYNDVFDALWNVRAEWLSGRSYEDRVANLLGTGTGPRENENYFLTVGQTILEDAAVDTLLGGEGRDWFVFRLWEDLLDDAESDEQTNGGM